MIANKTETCIAWLLFAATLQAGDLPRFKEHTITQSIKFGYQLVAVVVVHCMNI